MKVYIRAAMSTEQLKEQYGKKMPEQKFRSIIELDPTSNLDANKAGKYCRWLFEQDKKGNLTPDDYTNVKDALEMFVRDYRKYPNSDLFSYSVEDFLQATHDVGNRELTEKEKKKLLKKHAHSAGDEDKKFCVEDGPWEVWQPLTYAGSISLARTGGDKASWCTAYEGNDHYWLDYTRRGPLYIFINTQDPHEKYQLHFPSKSWYDIHDRSMGMDEFYRFCSKWPEIGEFFEIKKVNGVQYRVNEIVSYDDTATEIKIPEGITKLPEFKFPDACKTVYLPDSMTDIAAGSFRGTKIETVIAPAVTKIGANAFRDSNIKNIDLSHVDHIGSSSFRGCQLDSIDLNPEGVTIGSYAFAENPLDQEIVISPNVSIFMGAFEDCENLTVIWEKEDDSYEFGGIRLLVMSEKKCPELFENNKGYVTIETTEGKLYEI